jgi:hypothetical protein
MIPRLSHKHNTRQTDNHPPPRRRYPDLRSSYTQLTRPPPARSARSRSVRACSRLFSSAPPWTRSSCFWRWQHPFIPIHRTGCRLYALWGDNKRRCDVSCSVDVVATAATAISAAVGSGMVELVMAPPSFGRVLSRLWTDGMVDTEAENQDHGHCRTSHARETD